MKVASYNVNGINARLPVFLKWLEETRPDVVCLQELKAPIEKIPFKAVADAGYHGIWHGQKSWNGVAILTKSKPLIEIHTALPGDDDDLQSRFIEAEIDGITIICIYLPNGNPAPGPKYDYKLQWINRLKTHLKKLVNSGKPVLVVGDYNIIPTELDVYKPESWLQDALFLPEVRQAYQDLLKDGWIDALRTLHPSETVYTFYDYFRNAYQRNAGLRIDHFLLNPSLAPLLTAAGVDHNVRGWEKSSDHCPVWANFAI